MPIGLHSAAVASAARVVAGAGRAGVAGVWDVVEGTELGRVETGEVQLELALDAEGTTLITRGAARIARWDVASGSQRWSVRATAAPRSRSARTGLGSPSRAPAACCSTRPPAKRSRNWPTGSPSSPSATTARGSRSRHGGQRLVANPRTGAAIARLPHSARVAALRWAQDGEQLVTGTTAGTLAAWAGGFEPPPRRHLAQYVAETTRRRRPVTRGSRSTPTSTRSPRCWPRALSSRRSPSACSASGAPARRFFMRRAAGAASRDRATRAIGRAAAGLAFHKRIVQIEFNAWHYAEGNLWASLVEHILGNLRLADRRGRGTCVRSAGGVRSNGRSSRTADGADARDVRRARATQGRRRGARTR